MAVDTSMDPVTDSDEDMFCPEDVILDISADEWDESDASSDSDDDMEEEDDYDFKAERAKVLEIAQQQREVARWYLHPEDPVPSTLGGEEMSTLIKEKEQFSIISNPPPPLQARCYFDRASSDIIYLNEVDESAPKGIVDVETIDEMQERAECLAAASAMKETVSWYLHPERPVTTNGNTARCYFDRASAPEPMSKEDADDMAECLAAAAEMKERVSWYHHPSTPLKVDPTASARNYFQPDASQISTRRLRGESVMDQFEMEGIGGGQASSQAALFASLGAVAIDTSGSIDPDEDGSSEKEGNLSRSPSSVMLFEQAA